MSAVGISEPRRRAIRDALGIAGLLFAGYLFVVVAPSTRTVGFDAYAYWTLDMEDPYALAAGALGAFTYTPAAARLFAPAALLSWTAFLTVWLAILAATLIWLGWRRSLLVLAFPPVALELYHGNIHLLMAAAVALGFRYPAAWAFVLLTKVTPGVGLIWFAARREWRSLGVALAVTSFIAAISLVLDSRLWLEWLTNAVLPVAANGVGQATIPVPLALRLPSAALLVAWGGLTDRKWTVPLAVAVATPVFWVTSLSVLAALAAIDRPELQPRRSSPATPLSAPSLEAVRP